MPATHEVVVGDPADLRAGGLVASSVNWLIEPPVGSLDCQVKIRYRHTPAPARVTELSEPTLSDGETLESLRAEEFDPEVAAARGMAFEHLDQLALDHLYGVR